MRYVPGILLIVFAAFIMLQFLLLQYAATSLPSQFQFESYSINESMPLNTEEDVVEAAVAPFETTSYNENRIAQDVICSLPPLNGNGRFTCFAYFPRYFHNSSTKSCEEFIYGGCGGNENRFDTKDECEQFCLRKPMKS